MKEAHKMLTRTNGSVASAATPDEDCINWGVGVILGKCRLVTTRPVESQPSLFVVGQPDHLLLAPNMYLRRKYLVYILLHISMDGLLRVVPSCFHRALMVWIWDGISESAPCSEQIVTLID